MNSKENQFIKVVEQEKDPIPELPSSPLESEADRLYDEIQKIEEGIRRQAYEYEQRLKAEHPTLETLGKKWKDTLVSAKSDGERLLKDFYERARRGEFGKGELTVIRPIEGEDRLARIVILKNKFDRDKPHQIEDNTVSESDLLEPNRLSESAHFVELPLEGTSEKEYEDIFNKLRDTWRLDYLLRLFPKSYKPVLFVGETFNYGYMSHHSGEINAVAIVLPTGRLAVFSEYNGEYNDLYKQKRFWGVVSDPHFHPHWSAKAGGLRNPETLENPTDEEIAFLKDKNIPSEISDDHQIEEYSSNTPDISDQD